MNFVESIQTCFRKYADFNGRATRPEYWWFVLFQFVAYLVLGAISDWAVGVFWLVTLLPGIAVAVRRLHDTGRSGWWLLLGFIPLVGALVLIYFMVQPAQGSVDGAVA